MSTAIQPRLHRAHGAQWLGLALAALALLAPLRLTAYDNATATLFEPAEILFEPAEIEAVSFVDDNSHHAVRPAPVIKHDEATAPLFGMETEPLIGGTVSEKWNRAKIEIAQELDAVSSCRANGACPMPAQRLIDLSMEGAGRSDRARVGLINRAVDLAIGPTSDEAQWGVSDRWSAPFETIESGRGDCEDYAIVKYAALVQSGLSSDDVKIVIMKNAFPSEDHAVVAVRVDGQWLILDNRTLTLVRDMDITRAVPEFVLDNEGARRFVPTPRNHRT
jgi:predicted transglutaminase-like cysteine proteinase